MFLQNLSSYGCEREKEDLVVFCEALRQERQNSEVVGRGTYRVEMLAHVDV